MFVKTGLPIIMLSLGLIVQAAHLSWYSEKVETRFKTIEARLDALRKEVRP